MESQLCSGDEVVVVGGGNSAGQAAVFLAQSAMQVHVLVRSDGLADTMSRYLIRRLACHPAIGVHFTPAVVPPVGGPLLERVCCRDTRSDMIETSRQRVSLT